MNIGVFDSGIGGVTVLQEIIKVLPNEKYVYYSDSANNPYGNRSESEILTICENVVEYLIENKCKAIVIACNTASAVAVAHLRKKYSNIPFVAIEPAYKMVYDYAYENPTLVMATKGTIESEKFNLLLKKYDNHKTYLLPCVGLADIIEADDKIAIQKYLQEHIAPYKGKVKNVVLGCTHYPLIKNEITDVLGNVNFFNGAPNLARHLKCVLEECNLLENNAIYESKLEANIKFIDSQGLIEKSDRFFDILGNLWYNEKCE